ncbi:hypothetical protein M569_04338, partial [Genlisea aurea]
MDSWDRTVSDVLGLFKSWMPWRSEPANLSRDFWIPDQSCRMCYDCETPFTLFNRRHHCRHCGRIFCGKCTSNWIPARHCDEQKTAEIEWDKVRVCGFCFKQWEKRMNSAHENVLHINELDGSNSSISVTSFLSTRSSITCSSNGMAYAVLPHSVGHNFRQLGIAESSSEKQNAREMHYSNHFVDASWSQHVRELLQSRSDDDEDFVTPHFGSILDSFSQENDCFDLAQLDDSSNDYLLDNAGLEENSGDSKSPSSPSLSRDFSPLEHEEIQQISGEGIGSDNDDEFEASSSLYVAEDIDVEPMDFENNGVLWLPPEPEEEQDGVEPYAFEEDETGAGEWECYHHSSSFGSGDSRTKSKSAEELKVMKNAVDGHFRALVSQILLVENLISDEENGNESWLEIITALSWEAATLLKPDTSKGGQMDPAVYVKVKCSASGLRSDSKVIRGVVCKKNVAHRRMASKIERPRLLILGGALEYQRVSNAFSSFDTLLQQEKDHLKMAVAKLAAHGPEILLVEKSVSRYAQEFLLAKDISLVLNIKRPLLDHIARCTGAQIVPSVDLISSPKLGYCEFFCVERESEEHATADHAGKKLRKTLMYFEGCPKSLGCTILLKGAHYEELKKVKHVVQYGIFAAYHLALETSFLVDEGASLPNFPLNSPIAERLSSIGCSFLRINGLTVPSSQEAPGPLVIKQPFAASIKTSSEVEDITGAVAGSVSKEHPSLEFKHRKLCLNSCFSKVNDDEKYVPDQSPLQHDRIQAIEEQLTQEEFPPSPSDRQSILVSMSSRCVWKGAICERSHIFRIKYYGNNDKPLGHFLHDHLFDQNYKCSSCEMPAEAHVQCYTHQQGTLTISVKKLSEILLPGGREGKIWMWHRCLKCPRTNGFPPSTRRVAMSDAAWGLSLGKFLELSFSNHAAASRVASCGHSLHRDCLRFYGYGNMVACFRYASIDVFSVFLPPLQLDFNYENQEWIVNQVNEVTRRAKLLFSEVLNSLLLMEKSSGSEPFDSGMNLSESNNQVALLDALLQDEKSKFEISLQKIVNKDEKNGQHAVDILELNKLQQQLVLQSYIWDHRLRCAANKDANVEYDDPDFTNSEAITSTNPVKTSERLMTAASDSWDINFELFDSGAIDSAKRSPDTVPTVSDIYLDDRHRNQSPLVLTALKKANSVSDPLVSGVKVRRALSEGQSPICLSDTLDAVWTGQSPSGLATPVNNSSMEANTPEVSSSRWEVEDSIAREDVTTPKVSLSPPSIFTKRCDNFEESVSWLGMPFLSFYRSYKNLLGGSQKLDTIKEYDPAYISSFRNSEDEGGGCFLLPIGVNDAVIPVYEDEPTSVISYALMSPDYASQACHELEKSKSFVSMQSLDSENFQSFYSSDETVPESCRSVDSIEERMMPPSSSSILSQSSLPSDSFLYLKTLHPRVSFTVDGAAGKVRYTVTCYYAKCFKALRETCCPSEVDFVRSLSRCKKWGAQGGKSNVFFAKTLDERFIAKQLSKTELESFIKFAPYYFKYLTESIASNSPTCLAKILGIYQVASRQQVKGGKETKMDLLVMENLLFRRNLTRLYDLKGSSRSRYNPDSSGRNQVLLDQNLIEAMPTSPIFIGSKAKRRLERAIWNDTAFLASVDVMDYSLLVGVDEERHELVLGIIDFMRQYTWDKHLETWVKASGILGGPKNASPTVISPKQYKRRFRKAMSTYFLMVPDQWSPLPTVAANASRSPPSEN